MLPALKLFVEIVMFSAMLVGLFGLIVPAFPGITVIWAIGLLYGAITGFAGGGVWFLAGLTLLAVTGWTVDNIFMGAMAREGGAHWRSIAIAVVAGFIGSVFLTPIGGIGVTILALYLSELNIRKNKQEAWQAAKSLAIGWGWSFVARFAVGCIMIILWGLWAWA